MKFCFGDRLDRLVVKYCRSAKSKVMGRLASNGSQFSGLSLDPATLAAALAELRTRTAGSTKSSVDTSAYSTTVLTAIIGSYCVIIYSEAIGHVPIQSPTILLRLEINITPTSFTESFTPRVHFTRSPLSFISLLQGSTTLPLVRAPRITPKLEWQQLLPSRALRRSVLRRNL